MDATLAARVLAAEALNAAAHAELCLALSEPEPAPEPEAPRELLLIAEDHALTIRAYQAVLSERYEIRVARDAAQALALAAAARPALFMADSVGYDAIPALAAAGIPCLAISGTPPPKEAAAYLPKPATLADIEGAVARLLGEA